MDRREFARRRREVMRMIGKDGIAVVAAAPVRHRNGDIEYAYRQDSQFHYLSGFPEPDAVAVLVPGRAQAEYLLFVRERDPLRESWEGARAGTDGAVSSYGADDAFPIADIDEILPGLMEQRSRIFYSMGTHLDFDSRMVAWMNGMRVQSRQSSGAPQEFAALAHVLDDMRLYKSRAEQSSLKEAARIAVGAHRRAMRFVRPGRMEYEVMAEVLHEFRSHNADLSYHPIVAGGANACIMHYGANDQRLCDGDLLLLDAGCEHEFYASDISRTFRSMAASPRRSVPSTRWCSTRSSQPSTRCAPATTGTNRTRRRCASSRRDSRSSICSGAHCRGSSRIRPICRSSATAPVIGWDSTCMMWAITGSAASGACSSPAWRSPWSRGSTSAPLPRFPGSSGTSGSGSRTMCW